MIMNLGKLLGAGKSFFGNNGGKAYRENKHVYLPKFNAEKNPFESRPVESPTAPPPPEVKQTAAAARASLSATTLMPAAKPASLAKTHKMAEPSVLRPERVKSWTHKLNPFRVSEPVAPPMVNAVQTELSLESVKPIANDLADADIEVVPVRSRTVMAPEPALLTPTRDPWNFTGERVVNPV
jgi:hypothetical protein